MWLAATNAFMSDISKPDEKAFRMGMVYLAGAFAGPISAPVAAYLYASGKVTI